MLACAGLLGLGAVPARAATLVSTDLTTNQLVRIDTATGGVTVVGSLGFDATDVDLITVGDRLFAINSVLDVRVDLYELDPFTGAAISSVQVLRAGVAVVNAEGLARVGNQLVIGFRGPGAANQFTSNALGDLGLDGSITNVRTAASSYTFSGREDFDSLGVDETSGQLYGSDTNLFGQPGVTVFYTVTPSPLSFSVFHTNSAGLDIDDVVVQGGTLFAIANQLHTLNLATNTLSTTTLDRPGDYSGLALGVPEPASLVGAATGALVLLGWGRRRRRDTRA